MDAIGFGSRRQAAKHRRGAEHAEGAAVLGQTQGKGSSLYSNLSSHLSYRQNVAFTFPTNALLRQLSCSATFYPTVCLCMSSGSCGAVAISLQCPIVVGPLNRSPAECANRAPRMCDISLYGLYFFMMRPCLAQLTVAASQRGCVQVLNAATCSSLASQPQQCFSLYSMR